MVYSSSFRKEIAGSGYVYIPSQSGRQIACVPFGEHFCNVNRRDIGTNVIEEVLMLIGECKIASESPFLSLRKQLSSS